MVVVASPSSARGCATSISVDTQPCTPAVVMTSAHASLPARRSVSLAPSVRNPSEAAPSSGSARMTDSIAPMVWAVNSLA